MQDPVTEAADLFQSSINSKYMKKTLPNCLQRWVENHATAAALQLCMHLLRLHDGAVCAPAACVLVSYMLHVLLELLRLQTRKNRLLSKFKQPKQHAKPVIAGCIKQASPAALQYVLMLMQAYAVQIKLT